MAEYKLLRTMRSRNENESMMRGYTVAVRSRIKLCEKKFPFHSSRFNFDVLCDTKTKEFSSSDSARPVILKTHQPRQ